MELPAYKYIQHNITPRPWGVECQFTVVNADGKYFDDIVMVSNENVDEKELTETIAERLKQVDIVREEAPIEKIYTEKEVESLLISKGYLAGGEKLESLKSAEIFLSTKWVIE